MPNLFDRKNPLHAGARRLGMAARQLAIHAAYGTGALNVLQWLPPRKHRGLVILMYHSIGASYLLHSGLRVSEKNFAGQLEHLTRSYEILSLERAVEAMQSGRPLPDNAVALTFDDGFRDNYERAFPLLKKHRCPATIFVATDPLANKTTLWTYKLMFWLAHSQASRIEFSGGEFPGVDRIVFDLTTERRRRRASAALEPALWGAALPQRERLLRRIAPKLGFAPEADPFEALPMLTCDQLREMAAAGIEIGSHTGTHPALSALSRDEALCELTSSKKILESELRKPVRLFAYPFGKAEHFNAETERLVREAGYQAACTTIRGVNRSGTDRFALLRVGVQDDPPAVFRFKLRFV